MGNLIGKDLMNKMNLYIGILCMLYQSIYAVNGKVLKWRAALSAIIILSLILFMNLMFLLAIFFRPINPLVTFSVFTIVFILNYYIFLRSKKYELFEEEYKRISFFNKSLFFLSFLFLIFLAVYMGFFELKLTMGH
jgi:hypothetical protein